MKTENIPRNRTMTHTVRETPRQEARESEPKSPDKPQEDKLDIRPGKRIELERSVINNPEAVKKMIEDSIEEREMKFYQREVGGRYYIDIIDTETGNVIRTIPDTKFSEIADKYKQLSGLKINISG